MSLALTRCRPGTGSGAGGPAAATALWIIASIGFTVYVANFNLAARTHRDQ